MDASVIYYADPGKVVRLHIDWQNRYVDELVRPLARGVIRDAVSQYGVEEVYSSQRVEMTEQIQTEMGRKLAENGLTLVDFVLRNITFSPEYAEIGGAETDRRAEGAAGCLRGRSAPAGGRTSPPGCPG